MDFAHNIITYFKDNDPLHYFLYFSSLTFIIVFISCLSPDCFSTKQKTSTIIYRNLWCFLKGVLLVGLFSTAFFIIQKQVPSSLIYCSEGVFFGIIISVLCIPSEQREQLKVVIPALLKMGETWKGNDLTKKTRSTIKNYFETEEED